MAQARAETVGGLLDEDTVRSRDNSASVGEASLNSLAEIARRLIGCHAAIIVLADKRSVHFASAASEDLSQSARGAADPLKAQALGFAFYAGIPLRTFDGHLLGTLALVDREPRSLSEEQLGTLKLLVGVVVEVVQFRRVAQHDQAAATLGGLSIR